MVKAIGHPQNPQGASTSAANPENLQEVSLSQQHSVPGADVTVQGSVAAALQQVAGENLLQLPQEQQPGLTQFNSMSLPIDARVN